MSTGNPEATPERAVKIVSHENAEEELRYFLAAAEVAKRATCLQAHCGAVIVQNGEIIGQGYNSPPLDNEARRTCLNQYDRADSPKPNFDTTCCIHAEWRAILDACKKNPDKIEDSTIYFIRVDNEGDLKGGGVPYCTTCSRLAMEAGVGIFALWSPEAVHLYPSDEYDRLSYSFYKAHPDE